MTKYDHRSVEKKWQGLWEKDKTFYADIKEGQNKFYNLWMFPYPSAEGLHAGHAYASTGSDIYGRFMRMQGKNVFQPIGYDSFGIHSENFAIRINQTPQEMLARTTKHYENQLRSLGHGYDWDHIVTTSDIDYYRWTQWLFVELFKAGLAYKKKAFVNWCPSCKTVLADEQIMTAAQAGKIPVGYDKLTDVPDGARVCERCGSIPERKELSQWFFRITDYVERLLIGHKKINWSKRVVTAQREWIGKNTGAKVKFSLPKTDKVVEVFTTRLDTIFGVTFLVLSPEKANELLEEIPADYKDGVIDYIKVSLNTSEQERKLTEKSKTGVDTGLKVINPVNGSLVPVYVADYVLGKVGTGAVMGVPAHDARDLEFAKKYGLEIKKAVDSEMVGGVKGVNDGIGILVNSGKYNGISSKEAVKRIAEDHGDSIELTSIYHLRDWLVSRQRYWGPPIPMIYCRKCASEGKGWLGLNKPNLHKDQSGWDHFGWYPEENLPIALPAVQNYQPEGIGQGPLAHHPEFFKVKCPYCGGDAERETDVSDTFVDSAWYFLRYPSVGSSTQDKLAFDPKITKSWLPVDLYFGGAEHAVLHLMYARFITMALFDLKHISFEEPAPNFYAHGLMIKDGAKMSKSRGNVVNPDQYIEKFGADTLRLYLMFLGPMDGSPDFRDTGIEGMQRFAGRLWRLFTDRRNVVLATERDKKEVLVKLHRTIKDVTDDIYKFRYNTSIAKIMELVNTLEDKVKTPNGAKKKLSLEWDEAMHALVKLLAPFAPHMAEEVWVEILGEEFSIHRSTWPSFNPEFLKAASVEIAVQVNGKLRGQVTVSKDYASDEDKVCEAAKTDPKVSKWLLGGEIAKIIFVKGKIINFVVS
ncbi:leucine--tRNA ligase [Candidatus Woesebacteria bacterium]|nr:leucine--tRNA ligase [Candidatus Woesebacteria bacterium]